MEKPLFSSHPEPMNGYGEIVLGYSQLGSRKVTQLTDRGYAILNLKVPVHIRGFGPYRGLDWKKR